MEPLFAAMLQAKNRKAKSKEGNNKNIKTNKPSFKD
jgi:hypothetical protein